MYSVKFTQTALKSFKKLDKSIQKLASKAIEGLRKNPKLGKPLKGALRGFWSFRFSKYRIVYQLKERRLLIIVFDIAHRKEIYKNQF